MTLKSLKLQTCKIEQVSRNFYSTLHKENFKGLDTPFTNLPSHFINQSLLATIMLSLFHKSQLNNNKRMEIVTLTSAIAEVVSNDTVISITKCSLATPSD